MWQTLKILIISLIFCALSAGGWVMFMADQFMNTAPETPGRDVLIDIQPGAHLGRIAELLEEKKVVTSAFKFRLLARYKEVSTGLQAGRFRFNTGWLPQQVLDTLVSGQPVLSRITIPEGLTWWQTARLLADAGYASYEDLVAIVRDKDFLLHYGIPFDTAEGFLMPDTYLLKRPDEAADQAGKASAGKAGTASATAGAATATPAAQADKTETAAADSTASGSTADKAEAGTAQEQAAAAQQAKEQAEKAAKAEKRRSPAWKVAGRLVDNFWQKAASVWPDGKKPAREELRRYVTLASIVEKETAVPSERPRVAGVYANRLERGMLLQADPTVIYGKGESFKGSITKSMLNDPTNPYNTYQKAGLPPGPICSFGISALKAAVNPESHDYLYFVAVRDGGEHRFSKTLREHNRAVQQYRKSRQEQ